MLSPTHLAVASLADAPNTFPCRRAQLGRRHGYCHRSSPSITPWLLSPSTVSSYVSSDLNDESPERAVILQASPGFGRYGKSFASPLCTLTGICSVRGSSFAIVPARSHELVMLTRDCKSSDQKYPQVVPWNIRKHCTYESHEKARDERNLLFKHINLSRLKLGTYSFRGR